MSVVQSKQVMKNDFKGVLDLVERKTKLTAVNLLEGYELIGVLEAAFKNYTREKDDSYEVVMLFATLLQEHLAPIKTVIKIEPITGIKGVYVDYDLDNEIKRLEGEL